jgi:hypothetical protein
MPACQKHRARRRILLAADTHDNRSCARTAPHRLLPLVFRTARAGLRDRVAPASECTARFQGCRSRCGGAVILRSPSEMRTAEAVTSRCPYAGYQAVGSRGFPSVVPRRSSRYTEEKKEEDQFMHADQDHLSRRAHGPTRRELLGTGITVAAAVIGLSPLRAAARARPPARLEYDGSTAPYPIPWLDKNGSHNQSPGPDQEPSSIFHFQGKVARANNFQGMGTDNRGRRIAFGAPSTDFSFMDGEYFTGRAAHQGTFTHI